MARPQSELQAILKAIPNVTNAYFQKPGNQVLTTPYIVYERDDSWVARADNFQYLFKKRYSVTVVDRDPDSTIADAVEALPLTRFDRFFVANGLNHFVFNLYF